MIEVGNLAAAARLPDVRDVARAYWLALARGGQPDLQRLFRDGRGIRELPDGLLALSTVDIIEVRRDCRM